MTRPIEIHINELILHGFPPADRHRVAEDLQQELVRLFAERGVPASLQQSHSVLSQTGAEAMISMVSSDASNGEQIARAVFEGWQR